jgi:Na+-transporting NADH:ubiquinone oxidoreductase subunit F
MPGMVSSWLFALKPGDRVETSQGRLAASVHNRARLKWCSSAAALAWRRCGRSSSTSSSVLGSGRRISYWYGARNKADLPYQEEFDRLAAENASEFRLDGGSV